MTEHSENPKERVMAMIDKFNELRTTLVDGLLDCAITPEWKLWVIDVLTDNNLLPLGNWVSECPKSIYNWIETDPWYPERYRTVTFRDMLNHMTDDNVLERPELINECFDYIKKYKIIGTVIDW